jgi:hypothetical protein
MLAVLVARLCGDASVLAMFRYRLRTLLIFLAVMPPMLAWLWFTAKQNYGLEILAASFVSLFILSLPVAAIVVLLNRRRYILDRDRRQLRRSGLFKDNWPLSS